MIRAFLGIDLPKQVRSALAVQQFLLPLPRKVPPEQFHLTLVFLGELESDVLENAHDAFQTLRAKSFDLSLSGLGLFGGDRPRAAWAGVQENPALTALQAKTERMAVQSGCPVVHRRFMPHVTLGRFAPPTLAETMRLERGIADGAAFSTSAWEVREVTLWQSQLTATGARYDVLATYPLG